MTEPKHTPEPWKVGPTNAGRIYRDAGTKLGNPIARCNVAIWPEGQEDSNAARIVACVNACAGIENPEALGDAVRALKRIASHESRSDRRRRGMVDEDELDSLQRTARLALAALGSQS